jgi:hypothetical protein
MSYAYCCDRCGAVKTSRPHISMVVQRSVGESAVFRPDKRVDLCTDCAWAVEQAWGDE